MWARSLFAAVRVSMAFRVIGSPVLYLLGHRCVSVASAVFLCYDLIRFWLRRCSARAGAVCVKLRVTEDMRRTEGGQGARVQGGPRT